LTLFGTATVNAVTSPSDKSAAKVFKSTRIARKYFAEEAGGPTTAAAFSYAIELGRKVSRIYASHQNMFG
jgi:hypothetical protein